ncbi:MAG: adenylate kinase [Oscillospiraceae bacterium]|nr:adenylate kinase [Oscillospiraceae bacterium]
MRLAVVFKKIIVIGSPGAGKSTFSRRLRDITGLPLYHLDMINHKPDRTTVTREEFDSRLDEILRTDKWIIDGNYQRTIETRMEKCDTVFLLDFPLDVCLAGAASRVGKKREDMPWVENELDEEFRQWIVDFPKEKLPEIYRMLDNYSDKNVIIFKSRQEADEYLQKLEKEYRND